mgnify:CR=1 FL=1
MNKETDTFSYPILRYSKEMREKPFFGLTREMLDNVRDHDFHRLSEVCDDDFGIIDINTEGGSEVIRTREEWENWFRGLFKKLDGMGAKTWSVITGYEALKRIDMGYSVVDFDQMLVIGGQKMKFSVVATIIWKLEGTEWKESRYHSSLVGFKELEQ